VQAHKEAPLRLLDAPVMIGSAIPQGEEAQMSLFVYQPKLGRNHKNHKTEFVDRSDEAERKRNKREEKKKRELQAELKRQRDKQLARRDQAVITPSRRTSDRSLTKDLHLVKFDISMGSRVLITDGEITLLYGRYDNSFHMHTITHAHHHAHMASHSRDVIFVQALRSGGQERNGQDHPPASHRRQGALWHPRTPSDPSR
jgi:hypothetical protein